MKKVFRFLLKLLAPIGWLYFLGTKIRMKLVLSYRTAVPVICVGNIMVGGTGKTPLAVEIIRYFQTKGKNPHIISRGYGGRLKNIKIDKNHTAKEVGDEPLMLSKYTTVWVGANRKNIAKMAIRAGADILVMDDGFQNKSIRKDFSILVFDGKVGIGNGMGLPIGRLRESLSSGLKRANAVVIVGKDKTKLAKKINKRVPVFFADVAPEKIPDMRKRYLAFAGIGRPEKFYESLTNLGTRVIETHSFPDHYNYKTSDLKRLKNRAEKENLTLITTEKDFVRIPKKFQKDIIAFPIKMVFQKQIFFTLLGRF
ncbi:MAG: tetraacyldisaccharide 4'-kinase [Alphaproteobacteria bacterium]|nr:MAG: tetraacyldisaccharide 4'-kinase [Rickettsiaceae bacterium 4572_127]